MNPISSFIFDWLSPQGIIAVGVVIGLNLDDHPADAVNQQHRPDQLGRHVMDRAVEERAAQARGDLLVRSDVRGLKFGKSATIESIQKTEEVIALAVPSKTFEKEVYVQAAMEYFPDMNAETQEKIRAEIESAPTNEEKLQTEKDDRKAQYSDALDSAVQQYTKVSNAKGAPPSKESK